MYGYAISKPDSKSSSDLPSDRIIISLDCNFGCIQTLAQNSMYPDTKRPSTYPENQIVQLKLPMCVLNASLDIVLRRLRSKFHMVGGGLTVLSF